MTQADTSQPVVRNEVVTCEPIPGSQKKYVGGKLYKDIRVPMREIQLTCRKSQAGDTEGAAG